MSQDQQLCGSMSATARGCAWNSSSGSALGLGYPAAVRQVREELRQPLAGKGIPMSDTTLSAMLLTKVTKLTGGTGGGDRHHDRDGCDGVGSGIGESGKQNER